MRCLLLLWLAVLGVWTPAWATPWAEKLFATRSHDFGTVARAARAEYEFVFKNIYIQDVRVASATPSCSCISVRIKNPYLKTYEKGAIGATLDTLRFRGQRAVTITVRLDKPYPATVQLHVKGYIRADVVMEPPGVDFGEVERGTAVEKTVDVTRYGTYDWRVGQVISSNPHLSAEVVAANKGPGRVRYKIRVRLAATAPTGYFRDRIILQTNDRRGRFIPIQVDGRVCPTVMVSPTTLFLGVFRPGQRVTRQLVVRSKGPFRVLAVESQHDSVRAQLAEDSSPRPIHVIPVTFTAPREAGKVVEVVRIRTDVEQQPTEVTALAVVREEK
ncbi:MAG TPA: DUF1573 domain-containing protein [Planctomycetaceae bacterium]|nr:DUF1573 domain-containing protein [Planctomycetaceae bacterium]HIQ20613.1 DUF1573 domain-containing protein [Planctomycetota bacterium]